MTLAHLEALALAATPGKRQCLETHDGLYLDGAVGGGTHHDANLIAALDRETVLALIAVARSVERFEANDIGRGDLLNALAALKDVLR